jgi:hypothetical protein
VKITRPSSRQFGLGAETARGIAPAEVLPSAQKDVATNFTMLGNAHLRLFAFTLIELLVVTNRGLIP